MIKAPLVPWCLRRKACPVVAERVGHGDATVERIVLEGGRVPVGVGLGGDVGDCGDSRLR
jgi:hypothetical protein